MKDLGLLLWMILFFLILILLYRLYLFIKVIKLEKRLSKYTINMGNSNNSLFDRIINIFSNICRKLAKILRKSSLFSTYKNKYNYSFFKGDSYNILSLKIICGLITMIITLLISILLFSNNILYKSILFFLIGYFFPDIYFKIKKKYIEKTYSEDLIKVLTLMNHSFQSGKSLIQAITTVSNEMDTPLGHQFKKVKMDLDFGLDLENAFNRLYKRVPLDDIRYLTTSLVVFNQTGGNIVTIFKLIEKNFYTRKELEHELNATTASARLIYRLLTIMPLFLIIIITVFSPSYFTVLFKNVLGLLIILLIVILYLGYIVIIKRLMKIEYK